MNFRFWLVLGVHLYFAIAIFFGLGSKHGNYIYGKKAAELSMSSQKTLNKVIKYIVRCFSIFIIVFSVYPRICDIPDLLSSEFQNDAGIINVDDSYMGQRWVSQSIVINANNEYHVYFGPILGIGEKVTVKYLPHSKFIMDVVIDKRS